MGLVWVTSTSCSGDCSSLLPALPTPTLAPSNISSIPGKKILKCESSPVAAWEKYFVSPLLSWLSPISLEWFMKSCKLWPLILKSHLAPFSPLLSGPSHGISFCSFQPPHFLVPLDSFICCAFSWNITTTAITPVPRSGSILPVLQYIWLSILSDWEMTRSMDLHWFMGSG